MNGAPEEALNEARLEVERAGDAMRAAYTQEMRAAYGIAHDRMLEAERVLSEVRGEEHAVPCAGFPAWDTGAPLPQLLSGGLFTTSLVYLAREPDPTWDGTTARVVSLRDEGLSFLAVVRFRRAISVRLGTPNDEVLHGHSLHGKGLDAYRVTR